VTINDQAGQLDAGLTDKVDVALTGTTSPLALSDAQALRCMVLKLTGTHPGGAYEVHCPTNKKIYVVWNSTAGDVTFKPVAGTGIPVGAGAVLILYCDGANFIQLAGLVATINDIGDVVITAAASGQMLRFNGASWVNEDSPYDVGMFIPRTHGNGAERGRVEELQAEMDALEGAARHTGLDRADQEGAHGLLVQAIRTPAIMHRQPLHRLRVSLPRPGRQPSQLHVLDHPLAQ
jgi:hypothetical protein